jgi:hypothetical protein
MFKATNSANLRVLALRDIHVRTFVVRADHARVPQLFVRSANACHSGNGLAWLTLKAVGNSTVRPDELARSVVRLAMEGERDPVRLHDGALKGLLPAASWRDAGGAGG